MSGFEICNMKKDNPIKKIKVKQTIKTKKIKSKSTGNLSKLIQVTPYKTPINSPKKISIKKIMKTQNFFKEMKTNNLMPKKRSKSVKYFKNSNYSPKKYSKKNILKNQNFLKKTKTKSLKPKKRSKSVILSKIFRKNI